MMVDSLQKFGTSFQSKALTLLLFDSDFILTIYDLLEPDVFDSDGNKWLVKTIIQYYEQYKVQPTLEVIKIEHSKLEDEILQTTIIENLRSIMKYRESTDLEFIKEQIITFCKNQKLKNAIIQSVDLLKLQQYDDIKTIIDEAMAAGTQRDIGHEYIEGIEERLFNMARDTLETPWLPINAILAGGLAAGELGIVVAGAGIGKSWILQCIGAHAVKLGKTVIHYTLELNQNYVGLRYDTINSGIPTDEIEYHKDEIREQITKLPGKLLVKYYPDKTASINNLIAHVHQCDILGYKPDLIIVDYADNIKDTSGFKELRHQLGSIYTGLRGMAGTLEVPLWSASQANRCHFLDDMVNTEIGNVKIGNIKLHDKILTHKGYKPVTNIFPIEKQPVYKITLKSGKEINISSNHYVPTLYGKLKSIETGLSVGDKLFTNK